MMSRSQSSSYEGFRRKNSLNSHQPSKNATLMEIQHAKIKKEDLRLVENLSIQLQNISKRSLTSRSFAQNGMQHAKSCHSIIYSNEQAQQMNYFNKTEKEISSLKKITYECEDERLEFSEIKRQKGNLLAFNQFETIEQSRSFCQEEMVDDISPVTLKHNLSSKNKQQDKRNVKIAATPRPFNKKVSGPGKNDLVNPRKDKMKHDLGQLEKMQKQLQNKKVIRDHFGAKLLSNGIATQRQKQAISTQVLKDSPKLKLLPTKDIKGQALKSNPSKSSKNIPLAKIIQTTSPIICIQKPEQKTSNQQMVATRMLTGKQKLTLLNRLAELQSIIKKNEICSDSNEQLLFHMNSIQRLITQ